MSEEENALDRKNDIIANTKKKIAYLNTLMVLGNNMTNISTILKGFLATSSIATVIQKFDELKWINILFIIGYTIVIMCIDMYYLQMSRWYRRLYDDVTKLREDSPYFAWEFNNKYNFSTNIYNFQELKPKYWNGFASKSIFLFYGALLLIDITIGLFSLKYIGYTIAGFLWIGVLVIFLILNSKDHKTKDKLKKEIWEKDTKNSNNDSNLSEPITVNENNDLQIDLWWENKDKKSEIDCDVSVIICGEDGKVLFKNRYDYLKNLVCFKSLYYHNGAIEHCGDNPFGKNNGTVEKIIVKLHELPENVKNLFFVVNIYDGNKNKQDFSKIKEAYIKIFDLTEQEDISKCKLDLENGTGYEAAVLSKKDDGWQFIPIREVFDFNADRLETIINKKYK